MTIIPNTPELRTGSIEIDEGSLRLSIAYDSSAFMYDVYYIDESSFITKRLIPAYGKDTDTELEIQYDQTSAINLLFVIAYDRKYEQYVNTSNIFFKPNAFRPRFTTVEGGYGCFCSLNSLMIDLKEHE